MNTRIMSTRDAEEFHYQLETRLADRLREAAAEDREGLYPQVYDELYRKLNEQGLGHRVAQNDPGQTELLLTLLDPFLHETQVFVEIGAGDGGLAEQVNQRVSTVWAIDSSAVAAGRREKGGAVSVKRRTPAAARDEIFDSSVDVAFSCHLVEHLHPDDLPAHFAEVRRQLRIGGRYIVVTPNRLLGPHDISRGRDPEARGLHLCEYDHRQLAHALRLAGFRHVRALVGIDRAPKEQSVLALALAEGLLGLLPRGLRARALGMLAAPPHRPLEQVKLVAVR